MRYCVKCDKTYSDDQVFCSQCGENLVIAGRNSNKNTQNQQQGNYNDSMNNYNGSGNSLEQIFSRHGGLWIGIASMAISWWISGVAGFVFGIFGYGLCKDESSPFIKIVAVICCIIGIILGVMGIIYSFA